MHNTPNGSQVRMRIGPHPDGGCRVDDCIACHPRPADNLLLRGVEIMRVRAIRKRHSCRAAGECADTGVSISGNEPPHTDECECFLTRELAYAVLDMEDNSRHSWTRRIAWRRWWTTTAARSCGEITGTTSYSGEVTG